MPAVNEFLRIVDSTSGPAYQCRCGHVLGSARENFKLHCLMERGPVGSAGLMVNPHNVGDRFEFRQFYCPKCALRLETEVALKTDPLLWDAEIAL